MQSVDTSHVACGSLGGYAGLPTAETDAPVLTMFGEWNLGGFSETGKRRQRTQIYPFGADRTPHLDMERQGSNSVCQQPTASLPNMWRCFTSGAPVPGGVVGHSLSLVG